jgi:hypothetical protein
MAQATTRTVNVQNHTIPITTPALLPGLTAAILTGAGWVFISFLATILDTSGTPNDLTAQILLDGTPLAASEFIQSIIPSGYATFLFTHPIRPGAGQHTIEVWAKCLAASLKIHLAQGILLINEPGY